MGKMDAPVPQDLLAVSHGGLNHIELNKDDTHKITPIILNKQRKSGMLMRSRIIQR
jgi:galactokinase/mevalonate kinase-like predicted kinase